MGYNIYRTDGYQGTGSFLKRNSSLINGTSYIDVIPTSAPPGSIFKYYVGAWFGDGINMNVPVFESSSDTITIYFYVGIDAKDAGNISVYPNPANDLININSDVLIRSVEVSNFIGQLIYSESAIERKSVRMNVSSFVSGIYFMKITTEKGSLIMKIIVIH